MTHQPTQLCRDLQAQLPDYIDGEAKEAICHQIEAHLASCENCRIVIDTLKRTISLYHSAPRESVPSDVHDRLAKVLRLDELVPPPTPPALP